jgi:predicted transcriptional regulator
MVRKEVLAKLIDKKKSSVLKILLNSKEEMYLKEISSKSQVSITSTFRILQELVSQDILLRKEWKNSKVYSCKENEQVTFLKELFYEEYDGVKDFAEMVKGLSGVQKIILHGTKRSGDAKLVLLGEHINTNRVEEALEEVQKKGFNLSYIALTKQQYDQMTKMGLYSGEKNVL